MWADADLHSTTKTVKSITDISLNVSTKRGRANEAVEILGMRNIDICFVQESRWKGFSAKLITAKDLTYKFIWLGNRPGFGGIGVLVDKKWTDKVISVVRVNYRLVSIRMLVN